MAFSPLQSKLLPDIADMTAGEIATALAPLNSDFVEANIRGVERFKNRIIKAELQQHGVILADQSRPFEKEHIIQAILPLPLRQIFLSLGLCWNANGLAYSAFRNTEGETSTLSAFTPEDLRFALQFRSPANMHVKGLPPTADVVADGLLCFACWLDDVPQEMRQLMGYHLARNGHTLPDIAATPATENEARTALCKEWCNLKVVELAAQEEEATDDE